MESAREHFRDIVTGDVDCMGISKLAKLKKKDVCSTSKPVSS